jgi:hypothetical protein
MDPDAELHLGVADVERRLAAEGTVHEVSAMPMLRPLALTLRATSATSLRLRPLSAAAPTIFSSSTVTPTPRRPAV